jgi:phage repressor protein C with HTH and peptisase S24 domain
MDAKWLSDQLASSGRSQADLARHLGLPPPIINKMVKGRRKILASEADSIRRFFGSGEEISQPANRGRTQDVTILDAGSSPPQRSTMPRNVPILGTVSGGGGFFQMNGDPIDWARRPPRLEGRADVFGAYVEDLSMVPRYEPGELVFIERARPPAPGDHVVVEIVESTSRDERKALIKKLVSVSTATVRLEQYNPPKVLEYQRKQVLHMYRVMPLADLLGT